MILYVLLSFIFLVILYLSAALILPRISVNAAKAPTIAGVDIYILTNGIHTDLVLPVHYGNKDWNQSVSYEDTLAKDTSLPYIAIGWGDKGFYLETATWSDLKFSVAFKAMFHLGSSAMHITYYKEMHLGEDCKKITISGSEYQLLIRYIEDSFQYDTLGNVLNIKAIPYGGNDAFYEANRRYSLFYTCNTWVNNALKACNQKACLWTATDKGIFYQYR